ncbi:MAG: 6,7-dimethyl-8-ribityllumazine synthase [Acidimicrobiia bacterium]|jgi:6,7-dimethyl-8-ribityllumazine synthase
MGVHEITDSASPPGRAGVAAAEFNQAITEPLLRGALEALEEAGVVDVVVMRVPGALELPLAADALAESGCRLVVAVGAVIEGETDHYEVVARESARGLMDVAIRRGVPVGNAVLTVREYRHAVERAAPGPSNKGREAAEGAVLLARRLASLRSES